MIALIFLVSLVAYLMSRLIILLLYYRKGYKISTHPWILKQKSKIHHIKRVYNLSLREMGRVLTQNHWRSSLNAYLEKKIVKSDFAIHYYMGGGLGGETDFRLQGDGAYELWSTVTEERQRKSYCGQVPPCRVEDLVQNMLMTQVWQVRHEPKSRGLDEPGAMIAVTASGRESSVILWLSEIRESLPFIAVQRRLLCLIHELSMGEVLESGHWELLTDLRLLTGTDGGTIVREEKQQRVESL